MELFASSIYGRLTAGSKILQLCAARRRAFVLRLCRDRHRHQSRCGWRAAERRARLSIPPPPAEQLVRIDIVPARHDRNLCTRHQGRRHDLALQHLWPPLVPPPLPTCVHDRFCGHPHPTLTWISAKNPPSTASQQGGSRRRETRICGSKAGLRTVRPATRFRLVAHPTAFLICPHFWRYSRSRLASVHARGRTSDRKVDSNRSVLAAEKRPRNETEPPRLSRRLCPQMRS